MLRLKHIKHLFLLAASALGSGGINAQSGNRADVSLSAMYACDNLRWSIAGNIQGTSPNIYSELIWKNLQGIAVSGEANWRIWKDFWVKAVFAKAYTSSGTTDTDYGADNRSNPQYYGSFRSNRGFATAYNLMLGYVFHIKKNIPFTASIGYAAHTQQLYLLPASAYSQQGLESSYRMSWQGITIGASVAARLAGQLSVIPAMVYYQVKYQGAANWNLINSFQHPLSFQDFANGFGIEPSIKFLYPLSGAVSVYASGQYAYWATGNGTDYLYLSSGSTISTRFNEAKRNGWNAGIGVKISL